LTASAKPVALVRGADAGFTLTTTLAALGTSC